MGMNVMGLFGALLAVAALAAVMIALLDGMSVRPAVKNAGRQLMMVVWHAYRLVRPTRRGRRRA